MYKSINRKKLRLIRKSRYWKKRKLDFSKPRLCVFRSSKHIQVQLIDDLTGKVLASASSIEASFKSSSKLKPLEVAKMIGANIGARSLSNGVNDVVFDRNGFSYHGRVAALADAARQAGLKF